MTDGKLVPLADADEERIQEGIRNDPENPEWTEADFARARPFAEVFPELAASIRRGRGRPPAETRRKQVSLRLDADVIEKFKATGEGWQSRIEDVLKAAKL